MKEECLQHCLQMRCLALPCHSSLALKLKAGSFSEIKVVREAAEFWGASWDQLLALSAALQRGGHTLVSARSCFTSVNAAPHSSHSYGILGISQIGNRH